MKGVVFLGERVLERRDFPDPVPGPRDVILEIKASGMCGSDLKPYRAPGGSASVAAPGIRATGEPVIAGHEPCGVVVAIGRDVEPNEAYIGQRVMDHHYEGCGICRHCRTGWTHMCGDGAVVFGVNAHGAHAPLMRVPVSTLVPLPKELSFEAGAAISCGTGTAYAALCRLALHGDETIAIFGQGPVGLAATQLAVAMGARVIAVDITADRRRMAEELGAEMSIDPALDDPVDAIRAMTRGEGAHKALDCSAAADARAAAVRSVRAWGAVSFVGSGGHVTLDVSPDLLRRQVTLIGSWTFSTVGQADCARFVAERGIPVERVFSHRWRLDQAEEAYRLFDGQQAGKGVFVF